MRSSATCLLFLVPVFSGLSCTVQAEEYMRRGASVEDYEQALGRVLERKRGARTYQRKMRETGHRRTDQKHSGKTGPVTRTRAGDIYKPPTDTDQSDGVAIYFGFNSAQLTGDAATALRNLGEALDKPQFDDLPWLIEGHTDAAGPEDYNQRLSERRAQAAHRYLVNECGVDPRLLIAVGRGEIDPFDRNNPSASVNRRVRIKPAGE